MDTLVSEIKYRLLTMGITVPPPSHPGTHPILGTEQKALLLRVFIFGAFYPHYFSRKDVHGQKSEREALVYLSGLDPYSTVRLAGFPSGQLHKAYVHQFQERVKKDIFGNFQRNSCSKGMIKSRELLRILQVYFQYP